MLFHEVEYPRKMAFGSAGGPGHNTANIEGDSGHEQAVERWDGSKHQFDVDDGNMDLEELAELKAFVLARHGSTIGFRYWDPTDHSTASDGVSEPGEQESYIGTGDGETTTFQLTKTYTSGLMSVVRQIKKPIAGTLRVWVSGVEVSTGWALDTTTGRLVFDVAPDEGAAIYVSFQFCVPVRFSEDVGRLFSAKREGVEHATVSKIMMVEILDPDPGYTDHMYGGANVISIDSTTIISTGQGRSHYITAEEPDLVVMLPDPEEIPTGSPILRVHNVGDEDFDLKDHEGTALLTLAPNKACEVSLSVDGGDNKVWDAF